MEKRSSIVILAVLCGTFAGATSVQAATLSFTQTTTGSGNFNGMSFNNAAVTFAGTGDAVDITQPDSQLSLLIGLPVTIAVAGIGSFAVTDRLQLVSNRFTQGAGLSNLTRFYGLLFTAVGPSSYDLTTSFGPVTGVSRFMVDAPLATTGGTFAFSSFGASTYAVTVGAAVPEPAGWALMIGGFGVAGVSLRRRGARAAIRFA